MSDPTPYLQLAGTAREALTFYGEVFGRPWGASDGQVVDRYGVHWLIGFEGQEAAD